MQHPDGTHKMSSHRGLIPLMENLPRKLDLSTLTTLYTFYFLLDTVSLHSLFLLTCFRRVGNLAYDVMP